MVGDRRSDDNGNSDWTKDSLYKHFQTLREEDKEHEKEARSNLKEFLCDKVEATKESLLHLKELINNALAAAKETIIKAEVAAEKRFEGLNELREVVEDIIKTLISRVEFLAAIKSIKDKIENNQQTTSDKIAALEKRLDAIDTAKTAVKETKTDTKKGIADWIYYILSGLTILSLLILQFTKCGVV